MTDTPPPAPPSAGTPPVPPPAPEAQPTPPPPPGTHPTARTRISTAWLAVVAIAIVVVLLLVFILQNTRSVKVSFFTASGHLPLGVALLLTAIGGILLTAAVAGLRILQLRHRAKQAVPSAQRSKPAGRLWRPGHHQMGT